MFANTRSLLLVGFSMVCLLAFSRDALGQDRCAIALEKAAWDELKVQNWTDFERNVITHLLKTEFNKKVDNIAAEGGVDLLGIFEAGGDYDRQQLEELRRYYERTKATRLRETDRSFLVRRVASKVAYDAWVKCIEAESKKPQGPQPVNIQTVDVSEQRLVVAYRWDSNFSKQQPRLLRFETEDIRCTQPKPNTAITVEPVTVSCSWLHPDSVQAVFAVVTANHGTPAVVVNRPNRMLDVTFTLFKWEDSITDQRKVCTATVPTPNLDHVDCGDGGNACTSDGNWALQRIGVELRPNANYSLLGELRVEFDDNQGSAGWNDATSIARWNFTQNSRSLIAGERTWGSHNMGFRLCATEGRVQNILVAAEAPRASRVAEGHSMSFDVPAGRVGRLSVTWSDGSSEAIDLPGKSVTVSCAGGTPAGTGLFNCIAQKPKSRSNK